MKWHGAIQLCQDERHLNIKILPYTSLSLELL